MAVAAGNAASGVLVLNVGTLAWVWHRPTPSRTVTSTSTWARLRRTGSADLRVRGPSPTTTSTGATSDGLSAGEGGYGEGIQLDGTTNNVDLYNNTVTTSPQANFLLVGVENATIGGTGAGEANTSIGSPGAGMVLGGPSTECEFAAGGNVPGPNCNYGTGVPGTESPGWASYDNSIVDNTFNQNAAGVVVEGVFGYSKLRGPHPRAQRGVQQQLLRQHVVWRGHQQFLWPELWTSVGVVITSHLRPVREQ